MFRKTVGFLTIAISTLTVGGIVYYYSHDWVFTGIMTFCAFAMWWINWPFRPYPWEDE